MNRPASSASGALLAVRKMRVRTSKWIPIPGSESLRFWASRSLELILPGWVVRVVPHRGQRLLHARDFLGTVILAVNRLFIRDIKGIEWKFRLRQGCNVSRNLCTITQELHTLPVLSNEAIVLGGPMDRPEPP